MYGIPEAISAAVCQFPDLESAVNTTITAMQTGIPVARIELLDDVQMDASIRFSKLEGFAAAPTLFFEFHGSPASVKEQAEAMQAVSNEFGGSAYQWATLPEERYEAIHRDIRIFVDSRFFGSSRSGRRLSIPHRGVADIQRRAEDHGCSDIEASGLTAPILGHVGDGNFHLVVLFDPTSDEARQRAETLARGVSLRAIAMGGTCTGEHGIGWHKLDVLAQEHGEDAVELMRVIKRALDPDNIMNPGKTVPL